MNIQSTAKTLLLILLGYGSTVDAAEPEVPRENPSIRLESTFVGDKEQPAISYFIPWKGSETPEKLQWNLEPKHDQTLQVVDRDVLINSMNVYNELDMEMTNPVK